MMSGYSSFLSMFIPQNSTSDDNATISQEYYTLDLPAKTLLCDISITIEVSSVFFTSKGDNHITIFHEREFS